MDDRPNLLDLEEFKELIYQGSLYDTVEGVGFFRLSPLLPVTPEILRVLLNYLLYVYTTSLAIDVGVDLEDDFDAQSSERPQIFLTPQIYLTFRPNCSPRLARHFHAYDYFIEAIKESKDPVSSLSLLEELLNCVTMIANHYLSRYCEDMAREKDRRIAADEDIGNLDICLEAAPKYKLCVNAYRLTIASEPIASMLGDVNSQIGQFYQFCKQKTEQFGQSPIERIASAEAIARRLQLGSAYVMESLAVDSKGAMPAPNTPETSATKPKTKTREPNKDQQVIIDVMNDGYKGERFCAELDRRGARPRKTWLQEKYPWPGSYAKAWNTRGEARTFWHNKIRIYKSYLKQHFPKRLKVTKSPR